MFLLSKYGTLYMGLLCEENKIKEGRFHASIDVEENSKEDAP